VSRDVVLTLLGAGLGSLVTLGVAWLAARDARRILRETSLLLTALEEAGLVKWTRDEHQRAVGVRLERTLTDQLGLSDSIEVELTRGEGSEESE
jgi:hypothetical protein